MAHVDQKERPHSPRNKVSLVTARVVPAFLGLIVAYVSYVVVAPLSIDYLINARSNTRPPRIAAGLAIPIAWFLLLLPVAITYLRLLLAVWRDPGYIAQSIDDGEAEDRRREPPTEFWMRDVFVCDAKGLPIWCHYCQNWKPDRTHHNQDVGRCTLKMDHFCPWVGGVVGERSLNFFIQFLVFSMVLSTFGTVLFAFFVHESKSNVQWMVALGIAGFFLLFTLGTAINSLHMVLLGTTTIENLGGTLLLAVLLPPEFQPSHQDNLPQEPPSSAARRPTADPFEANPDPLTSEIDDPAHSQYFNTNQNWPLRRAARSEFWRGTVTYPLKPPTDRPPLPAPQPRTFAILETPPGLNIWDLGTRWRNFASVFGTKLHHWLFPITHSPCCDHTSQVSYYPLGPQFEDLLEDAGLVQPTSLAEGKPRRERRSRQHGSELSERRRKRRLDAGWQNGERPDGWLSEKEARRQRNEARRRMREEQEGDEVR